MLPTLSLVLGGASSGKSAYAENMILNTGLAPVYIATAHVFDDEMAAKVQRHKQTRGDDWHTIEAPVAVPAAINAARADQAILLDCATLWLTNIILGEMDLAQHIDDLLVALKSSKAPVVVVSNEVGQGIVPDNALSRRFRNAQGTLNQQIAAQAEFVVAVMAGLPLTLKGTIP
ncbi:MAG: bifunctional adenosylcobinamide kinase/adenosylcobinamide-phosphate guanylyltransferase [Pseudomonadota bacterium]